MLGPQLEISLMSDRAATIYCFLGTHVRVEGDRARNYRPKARTISSSISQEMQWLMGAQSAYLSFTNNNT